MTTTTFSNSSPLTPCWVENGFLEAHIAALLEAHPLAKVLTSMPGVAVRTGARILAEVGDAGAFPTAAHLASYAGLTPTTRRLGTSIRGEGPPRGGNKVLKRALFLASFASLSSPESRAYYDKKRAVDVRYCPQDATKAEYGKHRGEGAHRRMSRTPQGVVLDKIA